MRIEHCPTKEMLADILTKGLQGVSYTSLRDVLMDWKSTRWKTQKVKTREGEQKELKVNIDSQYEKRKCVRFKENES